MSLSIVIVCYNSYPDLRECISSIYESLTDLDFEIIVVDNCSTDENLKNLYSSFGGKKNLVVSKLPKNVGFGKAVNVGAALANCTFLMIVNPDVTFNIDSQSGVHSMIKRMDSDLAIGVMSPRLVKFDGSVDVNYRHSLNPFEIITSRFLKLLRNKKNDNVARGVLEVTAIAGAVMLIRREYFRLVGGFDEVYFMYGEDLDLSKKISMYGLKLLVDTSVTFNHALGTTSKKYRNKMIYHQYRSFGHFIIKWALWPFIVSIFLAIPCLILTTFEVVVRKFFKNDNVSD